MNRSRRIALIAGGVLLASGVTTTFFVYDWRDLLLPSMGSVTVRDPSVIMKGLTTSSDVRFLSIRGLNLGPFGKFRAKLRCEVLWARTIRDGVFEDEEITVRYWDSKGNSFRREDDANLFRNDLSANESEEVRSKIMRIEREAMDWVRRAAREGTVQLPRWWIEAHAQPTSESF